MLIQLVPFATALFMPNFAPEVALKSNPELDNRVLPDVHQQIEKASSSLRVGDWNQGVAHSDVVLLSGDLKYTVTFDDASESRRPDYTRALEEAMDNWKRALDGDVSFVPAETGDIQIFFQRMVTNSSGREVGGHVKWRREIETLPNGEYAPKIWAQIYVRTIQPNGKPMTLDHMRHVAAHELGHVLGLKDSVKIGDVMGPLDLGRPAKYPANPEIEALQMIRERATMLRRNCLVAAIQQLEGYNVPRASR